VRTVIDALARHGVSNVVGIPDNTSAELFRALGDDSDIDVMTVTREGEAFAVASGLWLGGKTPVVLVQNTGLLESGDSLRGTAMRMGVPLVCLVTYRGYGRLPPVETSDVMTRADVDSVAVVTEPTLDAWRVPHWLLRSGEDIADAFTKAQEIAQPVALLVAEAPC
jgi:sulfopyruvate decarboxylase subunit alpha